jgi:putative addiction module component (TIGR02574 family)
MSTTVEELAAQALTLSSESRARLADILVESLADDESPTISQAWMSVAKRRLEEIETGAVQPIPGEEALKRVRSIFD